VRRTGVTKAQVTQAGQAIDNLESLIDEEPKRRIRAQ